MSGRTFLTHVMGLRGLAIILVVWFHCTMNNKVIPEWLALPFGFYGVDVFFVIMGYFLIEGYTRKRDLTFWKFAQSKFNRIVIPMALMIIIAIFSGMLVLNWVEFRALTKTGIAAFCGISNYSLMTAGGYFGESSAMNPLVHTWYLSVTLQVFLGSYILFSILRKGRKSYTIATLSIIGCLSMAYALMGSPSYYNTFARLWEISAGGLVLLLPDIKIRKAPLLLSCLGLLMILIPSFMHTDVPAYMTVIVVAGATLVMRYGSSMTGTNNRGLLNNKLLCFFGKISYSLYLLHMPILILFIDAAVNSPCVRRI